MNLLLLEDDEEVAEFVVKAFTQEGYSICVCGDLPDFTSRLASERFDCLILDRHLPSGDTLEYIKQQSMSNLVMPPILFLTAKDSLQEKIAGLSTGDDYLVKPFAIEELIARVGALLRRSDSSNALLRAQGIELDRLKRSVLRNGTSIKLNAMEFKLLEYFLAHKNTTITRKMLLQYVWEYDFEPATSIVETYISRLRQKLTEVDNNDPIVTIRGVGYSISDE